MVIIQEGRIRIRGAMRPVPTALTEMRKAEDEIQRGKGNQNLGMKMLHFRSLLHTYMEMLSRYFGIQVGRPGEKGPLKSE